MALSLIQDYYDYCNKLIDDWIAKKSLLPPAPDPFLSNSTVLSNPPYYDIMPEPFLGNPEEDGSSIVMINLNPGFTEGDQITLSRANTQARFNKRNIKFSDFAKPFPYLITPEVHPAGADWWKKREEYLDRLVLS